MEEFETYMKEIFNKCKRNYLKNQGYDPDNLSEEDKIHINAICPTIIFDGWYGGIYLNLIMEKV